MISGALRIGSFGNSRLPRAPFLSPSSIASSSNVRLMATMPPMPCSVKPRPSGIALKSSAVMKTISE
jgi:hypothetical protein